MTKYKAKLVAAMAAGKMEPMPDGWRQFFAGASDKAWVVHIDDETTGVLDWNKDDEMLLVQVFEDEDTIVIDMETGDETHL